MILCMYVSMYIFGSEYVNLYMSQSMPVEGYLSAEVNVYIHVYALICEHMHG